MERYEGTLRGYQQIELFYQTWTVANPQGTLVLTHGLAEHSDCYDHFAQEVGKVGWNVVAWDLRGHGRSEGKRGFVSDISSMSQDLNAVSTYTQKHLQVENKPIVLFGHSLGGQVALRTLIDHPELQYSGLILSSPALGLSVQIPAWKKKMAHWTADWLPRITLDNEIHYEDLTRDEEHLKTYHTDPLRQDRISPALYLGMLQNFEHIYTEAKQIQTPVLMQLAGADKIVDTKASEKVFDRLGSGLKVIKVYPKSYHEIYNDLDRKQAFSDLEMFLGRLKESP